MVTANHAHSATNDIDSPEAGRVALKFFSVSWNTGTAQPISSVRCWGRSAPRPFTNTDAFQACGYRTIRWSVFLT